MKPEETERIETLTQLGLTTNQARIYLTLIQAGPTTAKEVSKITKINRQDVYRIMPALQKEGLVEKIITAPNMFRAIPMKVGIAILLKRKVAENEELKRKAKNLSIQAFNEEKKPVEEDPAFVLIPEKDAVIQWNKKATQNVQTSLDIVSSGSRFPRAVIEFSDARMKALKRGVRIRVARENFVTNKSIEDILSREKKAGLQTRHISSPPPAVVLIFDEKEVMIITSATPTLDSSALWSNNACLLALAKSYFKTTWDNAKEPKN